MPRQARLDDRQGPVVKGRKILCQMGRRCESWDTQGRPIISLCPNVPLYYRRVEGNVYLDFVPTLCCQCSDARCVIICPSEALLKSPSGVINIDGDRCTGCGLCVIACPFGVIGFDPNTSKPFKCDFCSDLVDRG